MGNDKLSQVNELTILKNQLDKSWMIWAKKRNPPPTRRTTDDAYQYHFYLHQ
jgi:hypothetical protein